MVTHGEVTGKSVGNMTCCFSESLIWRSEVSRLGSERGFEKQKLMRFFCRACHELDPIAAFQSEVVRVWNFIFFGLAQGVYTYVHICRVVDEHAACCQTWDVEKFGVKCSCGLKCGASGSTR